MSVENASPLELKVSNTSAIPRSTSKISSNPESHLSCEPVMFPGNIFFRYNSPIRKFPHLKCKIQWFLVYAQGCAPSPSPSSRTFSLPPKETP